MKAPLGASPLKKKSWRTDRVPQSRESPATVRHRESTPYVPPFEAVAGAETEIHLSQIIEQLRQGKHESE